MRLLAFTTTALLAPSLSVAAPSAGQLLSEVQGQFPAIYLPSVGARNPALTKWAMPEDEGPGIDVKGFRFKGNQSVSDKALQQGFSELTNTRLTPRQIYSLTDLIKQIYAQQDLAVSAQVPPQDVEDGVILLTIHESGFAGVELDYGFEDSFNVELDQIEAVAGASVSNPNAARISEMQRGQLLAIDLHGVAVSGGNHPNDEGDHQLELWVENTATYSGTIELDNAGNSETGEAQLRLTSLYASPVGRGGATYINAVKSEASEYASLAYRGPLGFQGATIDLQLGTLNYKLNGASASASSLSLGYRYPILRTVPDNLFLTLMAERRELNARLDTLDITLDGNSAFEIGRLTYNAELTTGRTSSRAKSSAFTALSGFVNFSRRYPSGWRHNANLSGQWSDSNLYDAERLHLGGALGLRGYSSNDGLADRGVLLRLDLSKQLSDKLRVGAFYDAAAVQLRASDTTGSRISSLGIEGQLNLEGDINLKLGLAQALNDRGSTTAGDNRLYARLSVPF